MTRLKFPPQHSLQNALLLAFLPARFAASLAFLLFALLIGPVELMGQTDSLQSPDSLRLSEPAQKAAGTVQGLNAYNQTDSISSLFERMIDEERFEEVIAIAQGSSVMDAKGFYYYGLAHFYLDQDEQALAQLKQSLELDPIAPGPRYYKAIIMMLREDYTGALSETRLGLGHRESSGDLVVLMGRIHSLLGRMDSAQFYWESALSLDVFPPTVYNDLGNLYYDQKLMVKAREMYEKALTKLETGSFTWQESAYNLGVIDYKRGDFVRAEKQYEEILLYDRRDYEAMEKLLQCRFAQEKYEEAEPLRLELYRASENQQLPAHLETEFRIDQFDYKAYRIYAHERFEVGANGPKHIFYITSMDGKVLRRISTEANSSILLLAPGASNSAGSGSNDGTQPSLDQFIYVMSASPLLGSENQQDSYYLDLLYEAETAYPKLKAGVIRVLEGEVPAYQLPMSGKDGKGSKEVKATKAKKNTKSKKAKKKDKKS